MPNIKSQIKRVKTNEKRRQFNASYKASMRTAIKNVEVAIETKNVEAAKEAYNTANKKLDKAVAKGICHKNFAARQKSRLSKKINALG
ncbi:MAG: 30S ribosomal protein S20 [Turicibacter sp.]|jgi:small subunit ribosomal protein S20|uniref:Small ribosomal subunit protein bS20 n=1 Tax=Turicibacter faecis TaxID=2963365 RepID=A0ABN6ZB36_9FIRM|nr:MULTISPECIES: 30S ribosomal protein S20 [unclassified Turicibacter]MBC9721216.1 30S ribosomal protein S20 [Lactobacillus sp.]MCI8701601.1 30S ribosomal protein S20 [Turicibacter sp.]BEH91097.1 30S ribosomal protein S20 [Turicibacter sp. TC023]MCI9351495.1 30S ribosomal protein S20 [Turicibacter sp.]MCU7204191.1 30S ribosomal protein S20 [Turicibacter sp. TA25]